ncbi:MAG: 4Fe-4S dicluster domain-containing protein [Peptococcaceae bacterium]|nr:MAG: 4Fe-4S dicluster domain-containing protein [Peptococcaceae bacterium]
MYNVTIDVEKCQGCGDCADNCPASILEVVDGKAQMTGDPADCLGCETCVASCEHDAITVSES